MNWVHLRLQIVPLGQGKEVVEEVDLIEYLVILIYFLASIYYLYT